VIVAPPLLAGAVQATVAERVPATAATLVGELGAVLGVTAVEGTDAAPGPALLVARTVNVYGVPFVRPLTVHESGPAVQVHVLPPGLDVAVYPVIGAPPFDGGADHETATWASPATAVTLVGAPGVVDGVTGADGCEPGPVPRAFVAVTEKVYAVPFDSPGTTHDVPF